MCGLSQGEAPADWDKGEERQALLDGGVMMKVRRECPSPNGGFFIW